MENKVKHATVAGQPFPMKMTMRALMTYETITGDKTLSFEGTNAVAMVYAAHLAGMKATGNPVDYTFEQFLDKYDDYFFELTKAFIILIDVGDVKGAVGDKKK